MATDHIDKGRIMLNINYRTNRFIFIIFFIVLISMFPAGGKVKLLNHVEGAALTYKLDIANTNRTYTNQSTYDTYAKAYAAFSASKNINAVIRDSSDKVLAMKQGMAVLHSSENAGDLFYFTSKFPSGYTPYCTNWYVAYYNSSAANFDSNSVLQVTLTISGYTGTAKVTDLILLPSAFIYPIATGEKANQYEFDYYTKNSSGELIHYISKYDYNSTSGKYCTNFKGTLTLDKAPDFMKENVRYYSSDGYNFYKTPYETVTKKNKVGTYCPYYQFLSYRTQTNYSATELNSYMSYINSTVNTKVKSAYLNMAGTFIKMQNKYGVNAAMEISFANLESAYGKSDFAIENFNFFGVGAVDSNPGNAYSYTDAVDGITQHAKYYMNRYYLDAYAYINTSKGTAYYDVPDKTKGYISKYEGDFRYFGSSPGNKLVGVNVEYASDPFHGEKIAGLMYDLDKNLGFKDYNKYSIGITNKITYAYAKPDDSSWKLYKYASKDPNRSGNVLSTKPVGMPMAITGETGDYYIVQSEMPMNNDQLACYTWDYDFSFSVAYVKKADVTLIRDNLKAVEPPVEPNPPTDLTSKVYTINKDSKMISKIPVETPISEFVTKFENGSVKIYSGENELTKGNVATGMTVKIYDVKGIYVTNYQCAVTGDINGDGTVSITDLVQINRQILGKTTLNKAFAKAADINSDKSISITDLVQINRHILGKQKISPN